MLAQNWDWHPDLASSTLVWVVEHPGGRFATLTEAGMLGKIGLNDAGLGVGLNLLTTTADGGAEGVPIHALLRAVLERCPSVEAAVELLCGATVRASSAVTVATTGDAVTVELSPGGPNVIRGGEAATRTTSCVRRLPGSTPSPPSARTRLPASTCCDARRSARCPRTRATRAGSAVTRIRRSRGPSGRSRWPRS